MGTIKIFFNSKLLNYIHASDVKNVSESRKIPFIDFRLNNTYS